MSPLSNSVLWQRMQDYYDHLGPQVWQDELVPSGITSNKYLANLYTRLIIGQINDYFQYKGSRETQDPFYIIELGVGHGRFSFYLLKTLIKGLEVYNLPPTSIRYVMTDISEKNIESWMNHPSLKPYIDMGVLDFAFFNAFEDSVLNLNVSGESIHEKGLDTPLFAIGNYLFDTLPHDAFQVIDHKLHEVELAIGKHDKPSSDEIHSFFEHATYQFNKNPVSTDYYAQVPSLNKILSNYEKQFKEASFLIPIGAVRCVEGLKKFSTAPLTFLVSDKGDVNTQFFEGLDDPDITLHGSVSMSVNFDALAQYTQYNNGIPLLMDNKNADFQVACLVFDAVYPIYHTHYTFDSSLSAFSPQDMFNLCYTSEQDSPNEAFESLDELLAILNLAEWDPVIFYDYHEMVLERLEKEELCADEEAGLLNGLDKVWDYFFILEKAKDIPFAIGSILYEMDHPEKAIAYYQRSIDLFGESKEVFYNMALAYQLAEDDEQALACLHQALQVDPHYKDAKKLLREIQS